MKNKHLDILEDKQLFLNIQKQISQQIRNSPGNLNSFLVFKFAFYLGCSLIMYSLLLIVKSPIAYIFSNVGLGLALLLFAFNFAHDFSHNTIFKSQRLNNLAFILLYSLVGAHAESWKKRHVSSHHFAPNVLGHDTDLEITNLIRVTPHSEHRWFHRYQHFYALLLYTTYSLYWIFVKDYFVYFFKTPKKTINYHVSFWIQKAFYICFVLVVPLVFSTQSNSTIVLGFFAMHSIQSLFLLTTFFMTHHVERTTNPTADASGIIQTSWLRNQVLSSNDMHPFSFTANFLLGGFNNHVAHHLFPSVHHYYYPKINLILYKELKGNNLEPNNTSYLGGAWSHLKHLKRLSRAN